jgi:hypothetical protein
MSTTNARNEHDNIELGKQPREEKLDLSLPLFLSVSQTETLSTWVALPPPNWTWDKTPIGTASQAVVSAGQRPARENCIMWAGMSSCLVSVLFYHWSLLSSFHLGAWPITTAVTTAISTSAFMTTLKEYEDNSETETDGEWRSHCECKPNNYALYPEPTNWINFYSLTISCGVNHRIFSDSYRVMSMLHRVMETYSTMKLCHYILTEETIMAMMNYGSGPGYHDKL